MGLRVLMNNVRPVVKGGNTGPGNQHLWCDMYIGATHIHLADGHKYTLQMDTNTPNISAKLITSDKIDESLSHPN